ncbi:unnamed protein product [Closterium sp. NIES-54]
MACLSVLTFDHEGRPIQFDTWLDDLQLYLLSDSRDSVSLFDHTSGASLAPPATADCATRSQWLTRDTAARLAVRNHLPLAERAQFGQHKTSKALYDAVVARYSSPATAALSRLILPYLFPELSAFATAEDLDHFLALDPTDLSLDLLEKHILAGETSVVAVGAACGTPRTPFFEGCSPSPLAPSYASAAAVDILGAKDVGAASALSGKRRSSKGKGGKSGGGGSGGGDGGGSRGGGGGGGGGSSGSGGGSGGFGGGSGGSDGGGGGGGGGGSGGGRGGAVQWGVSGGGQRQQQQRRSKTPTPQQLREWFAERGASGGGVFCPYNIRTEFDDEAERPRWLELLRSGVDILVLEYDAILVAMYALSVGAKGDCYLCVPPDRGIEAAALGARESSLPVTAPAEALHIFTLDSGASRCFFCDSTTLTPLPAPVPVRLADPSRGPVLARSSTILLCPTVPSGSLSGLHLPSFSTNLVSTAALEDAMVTTTTPGGQRVAICTCTRTGRHLATFTRRPRSSLYTLTAEPPHVTASTQVSTSPPALACPALPSLRRGAAARRSSLLVSPDDYSPVDSPHGLRLHLHERFREDLPVLRLHFDRGGEFSSDLLGEFCRGEGILQSFTLPASPQQYGVAKHRIGLVMEVAHTSIIHAAAPHFQWSFATLPTLGWTGKVGDASVFRVWASCAFVRDTSANKLSSCAIPCVFLGFPPDASGWQFYHPTSCHVLPSQDVTFDESVPFYHLFPYRTPPLPPPPLFLAPSPPPVDPPPLVVPVEVVVDSGAARGAAFGGVASGGAKPATAEPGGGEPEGAELGGAESEGAESGGAEPKGARPGGTEPEGAELGGAESEGAEFGGAEPWGIASTRGPTGASPQMSHQRKPLLPQQLREWFAQRTRVRSGTAGAGGSAAGGTGAGGAGAAGTGGARTSGTKVARACGVGGAGAGDPGAGSTGAGDLGAGGAGAGGTRDGGAGASSLGGAGVIAGAGGIRGAGAAGPGGARTGGTGAGDPGAGGAGAGGNGSGDPVVGGTDAGGTRPGGAGAGGARAGGAGGGGPGAGGTVQRRPFFVPVCHLTDSLTERREPEFRPASPVCAVRTGRRIPRLRPPPIPGTHIMALRPSSIPLRVPLPSPPVSSLPDVPDPGSDLARATSPTVPRLLATNVTDPSFESTAVLVAESKSDCPPSVGAECALGTDVLEDRHEDFECLVADVPHLVAMLLAPEEDPDALDIPTPRSYSEAITGPYSSQWQTAMDAEMASWKSTGTYVDPVPLFGANIVDGMWIFRVKQPPGSSPVFKARYVARGFSQRKGVDFFHTFSPTPKMTTLRVLLHVAPLRDYELHSLDFSTAFLHGSLHEEIWLRRPPGFTGSFPTGTQRRIQRPVYGLRKASCEWHNTLRTTLVALGFAPSTADPSLFLRTDTSLPPFYVLMYFDDLVFATADTEALAHVKSELQKRHTCIDLGELRSYLGLQIIQYRARHTITQTQSHMVHQVLHRFGFRYSSPQSTPLPIGHSLSAPPSDKSVEPSGLYPELVGCLMYVMTCTRPDLAYPLSILARYVAPGRHLLEHWEAAKRVLRFLCSTLGMGLVLGGRGPVVLKGHADASWVNELAMQRSSQGYTFSHGSCSVSWRSTRSSSVLNSSCEAEIYTGGMATQELRWLTYLLTDLGERPHSSPVLYVDNKAMIALFQEHRLEHRTKHIALCYFLARELQQRGQLHLAYVATRVNTADIFTKALQSGDHQRFCTLLDLVPTLPHLLTA